MHYSTDELKSQGSELMVEIALQGNLNTFSLRDVLQFADEKGQSGRLNIARDAEGKIVYFRKGQVVSFSGMLDGAKLGPLLHRRGCISQADLETLRQSSEQDLPKSIEAVLDLDDPLQKNALDDCLGIQQTEETVDLFSLKEGNFQFVIEDIEFPQFFERVTSVQDFLQFGMDVQKRWVEAQEVLQDRDLVPQIGELDDLDVEKFASETESWLALAVVDGKHNVSELLLMSPHGRFATLCGLAHFVKEGAIVLRPEPVKKSVLTAAAEDDIEMPEQTGGLLASLKGKDKASGSQSRTLAGVVAEFVCQFIDSCLSRKEFELPEAFLADCWQEILLAYPLADQVVIVPKGVSVFLLEETVRTFNDELCTAEVITSTCQALKLLAGRVFNLAGEQIGERKALSLYGKCYSSIIRRQDLPVPVEELQLLGLEKNS